MIPNIETKQDMFNHVATHLMRQREAANGPDGDCVYRNLGGLRCAVGCLIDDEHYSERLEGLRLTASAVLDAVEGSIGRSIEGRHDTIPCTERVILKRLQGIHDAEDVAVWAYHLRIAAHDYGLELPDCLKEISV
jgi:hypothetical protein